MAFHARKSVCYCNYVFVLLLLFLCDHLKSVKSFNLETRIPVIKVGNKGSYFGYSVAEHQVISEDDNSKTSCRITYDEYSILSAKVVTLFPRENPGTYFTRPVKKSESNKGKPILAKGKLVDKVRNILYASGERKRKPSKDLTTPSTSTLTKKAKEEDTYKEDIAWLQNNNEPWDEVVERWQRTYDVREDFTICDNVHDFLEKWKILNDLRSDVLINLDFDKRYPGKSTNFFINWEPFLKKILDLKKCDIKDDFRQSLVVLVEAADSDDIKIPCQITLLAHLLPPKGRFSKNSKFSTIEALEGILVIIERAGDIDNCIKRQKEKAFSRKLRVQPYVLLHGSLHEGYSNFYVIVDDIKYKYKSAAKAFDTLFKLYHVFHAIYPSASDHLYLVIQRILVGAPLDDNLQPNTSRSGALWKCPLTTKTDDCEQVPTDGRRTKGGTYKELRFESTVLSPPHSDEIKNGQWLGVSVRSQGPGKKVVVCAHRYTLVEVDSHYGQGLCYILNSDLSYEDAWEPCKGRPHQKEHEEYGFCQAGTSSSLMDDGVLVVGSPGPYNWRGTIFSRDIKEDVFSRDQAIYQGPVMENDSPVDSYSYLGMSVTGAAFFNKNVSYAAGAPRSKGTGQVVLYSKPWGVWANPLLNVTLMLDGEQFGSSFGYEVATADTNGDGKPDLLVGAPFYFTQNAGGAVYLYLNDNFNLNPKPDIKVTGKPESQFGLAIANAGDLNKDGCDDIAIGSPYDGNGVVFIYLGHRGKGLDTTPKQMIKAEDLPVTLKTFGYSLSGGIDLDGNGYPDLLVGAYEKASVALLRARPIIDIITFVKPNSTLKNIDPSRRVCDKDPDSNYTCFSFETCCTIESLVKPTTQNTLRLNYVLEAETFQSGRKFSRVFFGGSSSSQRSNIKNETIELTKDNRMHCEEHVVYIKENTRDIQSPIKFQVKYQLEQPAPVWQQLDSLPSVDAQPVLNASASTIFSASFLNDCGTDSICESDLRVEAELALPNGDKEDTYILTLGREDEIHLVVTADNLGESAYEAQLFVSHHAGLNYIAANVTDKHIICNLHNKTMVVCSLGNPFKRQLPEPTPITLRFDPKSLDDLELTLDFLIWANSTSKEITSNKPPVRVEAVVVKNAELSIKGNAHPEQVFYGGDVRGESAMHYLDDIGSRVLHTYEVFNAGPWRVPSVEVVVEWPHQVANDKPQGKWLLYLDGKPSVEALGGGDCIVKDEAMYVNPLGLKHRPGVQESPLENLIKLDPALERAKWSRIEKDSTFNSTANKERGQNSALDNKIRKRRHSEMVIKAEAYTDSNGQRHQVVNMNCRKNTAKCIKISCMVYKLARNQVATISVYARLWNSTLVEDYPRVGRVSIASHALIQLPKHYHIMQTDNTDDDVTVETVAYPSLASGEPGGVPAWVVAVAALAGLLVLVLLVLALWRLGFFKRSRPDPTLSANLEKHQHQDREGSPFLARDRNSLR